MIIVGWCGLLYGLLGGGLVYLRNDVVGMVVIARR